MTNDDTIGVLFVCMGNICRSPLAEGLFIHHARERGVLDRFDIDSAGTGHWHAGNPADSRSIEVGDRHGVQVPSIARQLEPDTDWHRFDYLLAMDRDNKDNMLFSGAPKDRVFLYRSFDPAIAGEPEHRLEVPDPYYGEGDGFQLIYDMLLSATLGFLDHLDTLEPRA